MNFLPDILACAVDPHVHALGDIVWLLEGQVSVQDSLVGGGVEVHLRRETDSEEEMF